MSFPTSRRCRARIVRRRGPGARRRPHRVDRRRAPRDVIEYRLLADEADLGPRASIAAASSCSSRRRRPMASRSASRSTRPLFDQVRTCDNHCEFCFIYQLPPGLRESLYLKDDDYRLSFLYGNFTTLTRFTEADLERVVTERLSPAEREHPRHRSRRARAACCATAGAPPACAGCGPCSTTTSRCTARSWSAPASTTAPCSTTRSPACSTSSPSWPSLCVVPLGVSRYSNEPRMRPHTRRGRGGGRRVRRLAGRVPRRARASAGLRGRRVLPARRAGRSRAASLRGLRRCTRTASAWPARSRREFDGPTRRARPARSRLLRLGRRRAGRRLHSSPTAARGPRPSGRVTLRPRRRRTVGILTGTLRRPGARSRSSAAWGATTCGSSRSTTSSSAATSA